MDDGKYTDSPAAPVGTEVSIQANESRAPLRGLRRYYIGYWNSLYALERATLRLKPSRVKAPGRGAPRP